MSQSELKLAILTVRGCINSTYNIAKEDAEDSYELDHFKEIYNVTKSYINEQYEELKEVKTLAGSMPINHACDVIIQNLKKYIDSIVQRTQNEYKREKALKYMDQIVSFLETVRLFA